MKQDNVKARVLTFSRHPIGGPTSTMKWDVPCQYDACGIVLALASVENFFVLLCKAVCRSEFYLLIPRGIDTTSTATTTAITSIRSKFE